MIYAAGIHDPAVFVVYTADAPSYVKVVLSPAEQDALMSALQACLPFMPREGAKMSMVGSVAQLNAANAARAAIAKATPDG